MRKTNHNRVIKILLTVLMMASLVACGNKDTMAPVAEDTTTVVPATEEPQEVNPHTTYAEVNELKYEEDTKVSTNGTLYVGEDAGNLDVIDIDWELTNITSEDTENGKTVTIEQSVYGYIWRDGDIFKTNLNVPVARLADAYTGKMIAEDTEVKWKEDIYTINTTETTSWENGNWDTDWVEDPNGGERLPSILKVKTVATISKGYDGLSLVLVPITDANGSVDGEYIMDVWTDRSYLFNVNDMSEKFVVDVEESEAEGESLEEESTEDSSKETAAPKEEESSHTHSYNGVVTTIPTCTTNGVKTYTCSCGDSYTENLGTTAHDFSVPITQTVHHDEVYQTVPRQTSGSRVIICGCGAEFATQADFDNHRIASLEANGPFCSCCGPFNVEDRPGETVYDYVKVSDAYDSEEVVGYKCSICGQQK